MLQATADTPTPAREQSLVRVRHSTALLRCCGLIPGPDSGFNIITRRCRTARPFSASSCHMGSTQGVAWKPQDSYSLQVKSATQHARAGTGR